ncbi:MAG: hypothetical protein RIC55_11820 [Pirellulaceae bacterium]
MASKNGKPRRKKREEDRYGELGLEWPLPEEPTSGEPTGGESRGESRGESGGEGGGESPPDSPDRPDRTPPTILPTTADSWIG